MTNTDPSPRRTLTRPGAARLLGLGLSLLCLTACDDEGGKGGKGGKGGGGAAGDDGADDGGLFALCEEYNDETLSCLEETGLTPRQAGLADEDCGAIEGLNAAWFSCMIDAYAGVDCGTDEGLMQFAEEAIACDGVL
jgi:hypothetical protein